MSGMVAAIAPEMPHVSDVVRLPGARIPRKCPFLASAILPRTGGAASPLPTGGLVLGLFFHGFLRVCLLENPVRHSPDLF